MKIFKFLLLSLFSTAFLSFTPPAKKYIIIDAGHGGNDLGATCNGISEKEVVLNIAKQIQEINTSQDKYKVILTRDSDQYPTLSDRTNKINELNPEMVISLHINSTSEKETDKHGSMIFVQNTDYSRKLADKISQQFNTCPIAERDLYILKNSKVPAILMDLGFINNQQDRDYLTSEKGQKEIAQKFVKIFNEY